MSAWLRRVAISTTTRAEFGLLRPVYETLAGHADFTPLLIASGTHLSEAHGATIQEIEAAGIEVAARIEDLAAVPAGHPVPAAAQAGVQTREMAARLRALDADLLLVLGDRYETLGAVVGALCARVPVLHLHGGELTLGAIDDAARHAITKLSHLHGTATEEYARRVRQLGEEDWRVRCVGALGLAAIDRLPDLSDAEVSARLGFDVSAEPFLLLTTHPETLSDADPAALPQALREGLAEYPGRILITGCNTDPGHEELRAGLSAWVAADPRCVFIESLGQQLLFACMRRAQAMCGNTSSGILEAPAFHLPTLNLGQRQEGRIRGENVLDVGIDASAVREALATALAPGFCAALRAAANPYGDGGAAERIRAQLEDAATMAQPRILKKGFRDQQG